MSSVLKQYPKMIHIGNQLIVTELKGLDGNELTLLSSDQVNSVGVAPEAGGGIRIDAVTVVLPQHVSYNPVKTDIGGGITS